MVRGLVGALCAAVLIGAAPAAAQDLFSPVIVVNDRAVTGWEIDQRQRLLAFFNTPGDLAALARSQLVEERLKRQELDRVQAQLTDDGRERALAEFADRADMETEPFLALLEQNGIDRQTLIDYVEINTIWRDYVRARFGDRISVSEEEVDQRLAQERTQAAGLEVLLSEIILPAPPQEAGRAQAIAAEIATYTSTAAFEAAAREVSAVPSRERGGRLDWTPLSNFPGGLQELLLTLSPGEVTQPIPLDGAIALLQLRDLREGAVPEAEPASIDYAVLRIPGGLTEPALAEAARVAAEIDSCDDLYGYRLPQDRLLRLDQAPAEIPQDIALALSALDADEATWGLTADGGRTLLFVMLCARNSPLPEGAEDRDAVAAAIRSERLQQYSDAVVADLRAAATIVGE